jgi:HK97 family phage portal protein
MGLLDFLLPTDERAALARVRQRRERAQFTAQASIGDPAFATWLMQRDDSLEAVTPYTVIGLSAVLRAVSIITTIAGLPLRTFERQGSDRVRIPSEFDDPYPGQDGMTPFEWVETVLIHLLLWRNAYLWHEARADGSPGIAYRPISPDSVVRVKRVNGRKVFEYREAGASETKEVGSEQITHIPGPSLDGSAGHPLLYGARAVFSSAISGDKTAQKVLRRGIRIAGLLTPGDNEQDDFEEGEGEAILESLRKNMLGSDNAGDILALNRRVKVQPWTVTSNIESQWHETLMFVLMEIEQLFGVPPHLMADTEKQTSWGTGIAEQNLGLQKYTLSNWSDRIEQRLTRRLPNGRVSGPDGQFVEFDYKGFLSGTPADEIKLLILQVEGGLLLDDEARQILNRRPFTPAERAQIALRQNHGGSVLDLPSVPNEALT